MKLHYDPFKDDLMVGEQTLRQFYIHARKDAGITIGKLERDCNFDPGRLRRIEVSYSGGKASNSIKSILAALEILGYGLEIGE